MKVEIQECKFNCPKCKQSGLKVISRGETPIYYHCGGCKLRFTASWKWEDEKPLQVLAVLDVNGEQETFVLGKTAFGE